MRATGARVLSIRPRFLFPERWSADQRLHENELRLMSTDPRGAARRPPALRAPPIDWPHPAARVHNRPRLGGAPFSSSNVKATASFCNPDIEVRVACALLPTRSLHWR